MSNITLKNKHMSTELKSTNRHNLTKFWGGDDFGYCVQISCEKQRRPNPKLEDTEGFVQLTLSEAAETVNALISFIHEEANRRKQLLQEEIKNKEIFNETVFKEVANLPDVSIASDISVDLINKFSPIVQKDK